MVFSPFWVPDKLLWIVSVPKQLHPIMTQYKSIFLKADVVTAMLLAVTDRVDYVDSFGRSRRCLRKDLADMVGSGQKTSNTAKYA